MNEIKQIFSIASQLLLGAHYYRTLRERIRHNAEEASAGRAPIMVLFYHRIADDGANKLSMPFATFARQIRWLRDNFDLVSLEEAQRRVAVGHNDRPAVAITFDDGYATNYEAAVPFLVEKKIPVTYFVASKHILEGRPFPHDVAKRQPLAVNTVEQLRKMIDSGVEIGAHTRTHADLGKVKDPAVLFDELSVCRDELEDALKCPIRYFSFPYGLHKNLSWLSFVMAREIGFAGVCSAYGGYNFPGDDAFHLQRIHADHEMIRLKNWLTVDPRKLERVRRFVPEEARDAFQPVSGVS